MYCSCSLRGLDIIDGVYNNFSDSAGFADECMQGREIGMDGKTLIHPSQIDSANRFFSPTEEEIDWARRVKAVFDDPLNAGSSVVSIDGKMVERLHAEDARRVLFKAEAATRRVVTC
jgi:citrate lyase subunit beta/citryl-CoA lyase